jgi:hypothetical protein
MCEISKKIVEGIEFYIIIFYTIKLEVMENRVRAMGFHRDERT